MNKNDFEGEISSIVNRIDSSKLDIAKNQDDIAYVDHYSTKEQNKRDKLISDLLSDYVKSYDRKIEVNSCYKRVIFITCIAIVVFFSVGLLFVIGFSLHKESNFIGNVQMITICVTFMTSIVGLLQIITKYLFPENEEQYITQIVQIIQQNDLEHKKENIKSRDSNNRRNHNVR